MNLDDSPFYRIEGSCSRCERSGAQEKRSSSASHRIARKTCVAYSRHCNIFDAHLSWGGSFGFGFTKKKRKRCCAIIHPSIHSFISCTVCFCFCFFCFNCHYLHLPSIFLPLYFITLFLAFVTSHVASALSLTPYSQNQTEKAIVFISKLL